MGLIDVDGHHLPNLCLMKISAYHKARDDLVEWWNGFVHYDIVYKSKVFSDSYTLDDDTVINADRVIEGGTGFGLDNRLPDEIEHMRPDDTLYPQYGGTAYGFLTRGCPRACGFCIVSKKEGRQSRQVADLSEFWDGQKEIKLLDANLLASREHERLLCQLSGSGARVDFTQGLDIRLVTRDNAALLNRLRVKAVHFAWDNPGEDLTGQFERFREWSNLKNHRQRVVYVLCNYNSTHEQDLYRIDALRRLDYSPYVMIYDKPRAPKITRRLGRWVNNSRIFWSVERFSDYEAYRRR